MGYEEKILEFLGKDRKSVCDDCLSSNLKIYPRQTVNMICRGLEDKEYLSRERKLCSICRKHKICNTLLREQKIFRRSEALKPEEKDVLLKIYIGQNIRKEGILQSEVMEKEQIQVLLSEGLIKENHWYLDQFLTTDLGSDVGKLLIEKRIENNKQELQVELDNIPKMVVGFFIKRHISKELVFTIRKPFRPTQWEDSILADGRIWILWNEFFRSLETVGLCVRTHDYVATRGGERRDLCYVISSEMRKFLINRLSISDFAQKQEVTLKLYNVLMSTSRILHADIDYVRQRYYELLRDHSLAEDQLAGIVNDMNRKQITSKYRGLFSEKKPFEVMDSTSFQIYLEKNLIEPAINILLEKRGKIKEYIVVEKMPSLSQVKSEIGLLEDLGAFYIMISSLERQLREFIKQKIGKGWMRRVRNELPDVAERWEEKKAKDEKWGIDPEEDLINYADLGDYVQIIKKFKRLFTDSDQNLSYITTRLVEWYNYGRNPIMHSRTVNMEKYYTTKSAIKYLEQWMSRKQNEEKF